MQRILSLNNNFCAINLKSLVILSVSLTFGYLILDANILFILFFVVLLIGCYFFIHESNYIYMIFLLPLEHLIIFETDFADLRLVQIVFVIVLISLACKRYVFHQGIKFFKKTSLDLPLWLMLVAYMVSSIFSAYLMQGIREILQLIYLICLFKFFASVLDSKEKLEKTLKIFMFGVFLISINIFSQRFIGTSIIPCIRILPTGMVNLSFDTAVGLTNLFVAPNISYMSAGSLGYGRPGIALLSVMAFFLAFGFFRKASYSLGRRVLWGVLAGVFLGSLVFSYSRAGILAMLVGIMLLILKKKRFLEFAMLAFVFLYVFVLPTATHYRFLESFAVEEGSFKSHLTSWETCMDMFQERPLMGFGPGSYAQIGNIYSIFWNDVNDPHSFIFLTMAELGIIGLLPLGWFTASIFKICGKQFWRQKYSAGESDMKTELFVVLVACFILATTTPVFQTGYYWGFMGITYAAFISVRNDENDFSKA